MFNNDYQLQKLHCCKLKFLIIIFYLFANFSLIKIEFSKVNLSYNYSLVFKIQLNLFTIIVTMPICDKKCGTYHLT